MPDELKEGDEVVLRGKIDCILTHADGRSSVFVEHERYGEIITVILCDNEADCLHKVRPGTYEVTARDVAKMTVRAYRERKTELCMWGHWNDARDTHGSNFKKLRRWVHCRLRELKRKRKL